MTKDEQEMMEKIHLYGMIFSMDDKMYEIFLQKVKEIQKKD